MTTVTLEQAQNNLTRLIEDVALGEHVVIMKNNVPIAELAPVFKEKSRPTFGSARGLIEMSDDFDTPIDDMRDYVG